ncbi:MAG: 3-oxoacyl-ACP synthase [Burkholderiales bacterium]|nr:3-oxoacyl-ACP synthase [Burkholderiales bacterium]
MKAKSTKKIDWDKVDAIPEDSYNYDEAPELTEEFLKIAFIRKPTQKKPVSLRLDDDIIDFFKRTNEHYQTKINDVLRAYKLAYEKTHH